MDPRILAIDIGGGTQDLLLWDPDQQIESAVKMVLPSPTQATAARIRAATAALRTVFLQGYVMGGGACARAVREHLAAGALVYATPETAATFNDDLHKVEAMGVRLTQAPPRDAVCVFMSDLDLVGLHQILTRHGLSLPPTLAAAVCDHGFSPGHSNRKFRFEVWRRFLGLGGRLKDLITASPAKSMTRMQALKAQAPGALLMDTAAAAIWGALQDPVVAARAGEGICIVNAGNMHTVAFIVLGSRVQAVYEHHTFCLDTPMLRDHIQRFISGALSDDEVFAGKGHGLIRQDGCPARVSEPVILTGPQRRLARGLGWQTAVPHGDVMLSGCFGLVSAARAMMV